MSNLNRRDLLKTLAVLPVAGLVKADTPNRSTALGKWFVQQLSKGGMSMNQIRALERI